MDDLITGFKILAVLKLFRKLDVPSEFSYWIRDAAMRSEDLFTGDEGNLKWMEVLYGDPIKPILPDFCVNCMTQLGTCVDGRVRTYCHKCQGSMHGEYVTTELIFSIGTLTGYNERLINYLLINMANEDCYATLFNT